MSLSVAVLSPWAFYNQFITLQWLIINDVCTIATFHFSRNGQCWLFRDNSFKVISCFWLQILCDLMLLKLQMLNCDDAKTFRAGNSVRGICSVAPWGPKWGTLLSRKQICSFKSSVLVSQISALLCATQECVHSAAVTQIWTYRKLFYICQHTAHICHHVAWNLEVTSRPCKPNNQLSCSTSPILFLSLALRDLTWVHTNHVASAVSCIHLVTLWFSTPHSLSCRFIPVFTQCSVEAPKWIIFYFVSAYFCVGDWLQWIWKTEEPAILVLQPKALQSLAVVQ